VAWCAVQALGLLVHELLPTRRARRVIAQLSIHDVGHAELGTLLSGERIPDFNGLLALASGLISPLCTGLGDAYVRDRPETTSAGGGWLAGAAPNAAKWTLQTLS
jgi:hypothetical protein